jgi:hypothetical protein
VSGTFLELAQSIQMAIKSLQMYTAAHPRSQEALQNLSGCVSAWLRDRAELQMAASAGKVFVDGAPVEGSSLHLAALVRQLSERQVAGFVIQRGVPPEELQAMLEILILKPAKLEEQGGVAKVLAGRNLKFIALSQTQYREVREGEGGEEDHGGWEKGTEEARSSQADPGAAEPLAIDIAEALDHWKQQLLAAVQGLTLSADHGVLGYVPAADLSRLRHAAEEAGWGSGFPSAAQIESLRQGLRSLPEEVQLSVLKGLDSLPFAPAGLAMGFQALAPEVLAQAATGLLGRGVEGRDLQETLYEILRPAPGRPSMLAGFESAMRGRGLGPALFADLLRQLSWDDQPLDEKIRRALDEHQFWDLGLEQRLGFLRELLEQGRMDPFLRLLERVLEGLAHEAPASREAAAQTLAGLSHWTAEPLFPLEAEGPMLDGLKGHFGWEPLPHIHRSTEECLDALIQGFVKRGEIAHVQDLLQELRGLLAFLDDSQEWRAQALERLGGRLSTPGTVAAALEAMYRSDPDAVLSVFLPYFESLGETGGAELVRLLGEEPDRKRRGRLMDLLRLLGTKALPALKASLRSPVWYLVRNTLNLLADMGDAGMLPDVAQCLQHGDGRVKRAAIRAVWKLGGPSCVPYLLPVFPGSDPETQIEILFGLASVQAEGAVPLLADFIRVPGAPAKVRLKAIETLGLIGHPAAIPALLELVRRKGRIFTTAEPTDLRVGAARALAAIGTPEAMDALRRLVDDEPRSGDKAALQLALETPRRAQGAP